MKIIDKTVLSEKAPSKKNVLWVDSNSGTLKIPYKGKWKAVENSNGNSEEGSGGSNSGGSASNIGSIDAIMRVDLSLSEPEPTLTLVHGNFESVLEKLLNSEYVDIRAYGNLSGSICPFIVNKISHGRGGDNNDYYILIFWQANLVGFGDIHGNISWDTEGLELEVSEDNGNG